MYCGIHAESGARVAETQLVRVQQSVREMPCFPWVCAVTAGVCRCMYRDPMRHTYITGGASTAVAFATQLKALEDDLRKKSGGSSSNFGSRYLHVPISSLEGSPSGGSDRHASKRLSDIGKRLFQSPGGSVAAPLSTDAPSKSPSHRGDQQCALEPRPSFTFDTMSPPTVGDTSALRPPTSFTVQTSWHAPRSCPQMGRRPRVTVRDVSAILEDDESSTLDVSPILPTRQLDKRSTGHSNTVIGSAATSPPKFSYHFGPSGGGDAVSSPTTMAAGDGVSGKITALPQASPFSLLSQRKRLQPVAFTA
jgi:hypothetical protein